jgi:hypothetical protein
VVRASQTRKPDGSLDDKSYVKLSDKLFESIKNGYLAAGERPELSAHRAELSVSCGGMWLSCPHAHTPKW